MRKLFLNTKEQTQICVCSFLRKDAIFSYSFLVSPVCALYASVLGAEEDAAESEGFFFLLRLRREEATVAAAASLRS